VKLWSLIDQEKADLMMNLLPKTCFFSSKRQRVEDDEATTKVYAHPQILAQLLLYAHLAAILTFYAHDYMTIDFGPTPTVDFVMRICNNYRRCHHNIKFDTMVSIDLVPIYILF
jgi:hypothetical protein